MSAHMALVEWTAEAIMMSDHLPISISFNDDCPCPRMTRTYVNFKCADWPGYVAELETLVSQLLPPMTCSSGEKSFRDAVHTAAEHHIPAGYRKDYIPSVNREAQQLEEEFNECHLRDPQDPALPDLQRLPRALRGVNLFP